MERLLNLAMDLVIPPATMVTLAFAWPTLTFLRAAEWAVKTLTQEDVRGKVVLVTGASSAVGEQVAYEYARRGAHLVLAARREQRLFAVRDRARALGAGHVLVVAADVVRDDDCRRLVADTVAYLGQRESQSVARKVFEFMRLIIGMLHAVCACSGPSGERGELGPRLLLRGRWRHRRFQSSHGMYCTAACYATGSPSMISLSRIELISGSLILLQPLAV